MKNNNKNYNSRAILLNPIVIILYGIACYYIAELAEFGGISRRIPVILLTVGLLIVWFLWSFFKPKPKRAHSKLERYAKPWFYVAVTLIVIITGVTTYDVYQSSINYQGKLSWLIQDLKSTRKITFENNNIYEHGIEGILQDINAEVPLPEDLFISNEFSLSFNEEGIITSIYSFMYGENEKGTTETFLVSYDADEDDRIIVTLDGYVDDAHYSKGKALHPLVDATEILPIESIITEWNDDAYNVYYIGQRNWGYNTDGIIYYNDTGILGAPVIPYSEINDFTTSIYPADDISATPNRFVYTDAETLTGAVGYPATVTPLEERSLEVAEEFYLSDQIGYQLVVRDAALGKRFYGLNKTLDSGSTWEMHNADPFNGDSGAATGINFINENIGFIGMSHSGGTHADLYRTNDGGLSFEEIVLPEVQLPLNDEEDYNPFVFSEMPYLENDKLVLYVNQGPYGDYNNGIRALFYSYDNGERWEYIREEE